MWVPVIARMLVRLCRTVADMGREHARARRSARIISHIEGLPPYLLRDIGLRDAADIAAAVDGGKLRAADCVDRRNAVAILPHAA